MIDWNCVSVETPPTATPLTVAEVRTHLRLGADDETDDYLNFLIAAAVAQIDGAQNGIGYAMLHQTWRLTLDNFDWSGTICLPGWPVTAVTAIRYTDTDNAEQTLDAAAYKLIKDRTVAQIYPVTSEGVWSYWPTDYDYRPGKVQVDYTLGAADADGVPADLKLALLMMVGKWYMAREGLMAGSLSEIPAGATAILNKYRWGPSA